VVCLLVGRQQRVAQCSGSARHCRLARQRKHEDRIGRATCPLPDRNDVRNAMSRGGRRMIRLEMKNPCCHSCNIPGVRSKLQNHPSTIRLRCLAYRLIRKDFVRAPRNDPPVTRIRHHQLLPRCYNGVPRLRANRPTKISFVFQPDTHIPIPIPLATGKSCQRATCPISVVCP